MILDVWLVVKADGSPYVWNGSISGYESERWAWLTASSMDCVAKGCYVVKASMKWEAK